ncbi:MAG: pitrilysin family protein [Sphingomonadaceae bacterium]|nr:pitrilysin family protein [Sphingomonadaceae bacterium]
MAGRWLALLAAGTMLVSGSAAIAAKKDKRADARAVAALGPSPDLVAAVDIPYEQFTLSNGLRVVVHTDRKVPIVATSIWYHVGSKDEPAGKTGFAHLFEHFMFEGSEHVKDYDKPLEDAGATGMNGSTWFDRTNYVQTVPTGALDLVLFLESDRMGHLLGTLNKESLDQQRGVVQNEKRQGDNEPYGMVEYEILEALFPEGHGYRHSTIGSMEDLTAASLDDVKEWFRTWNTPNNAVLVLAGDIDAATARPLVEKYFGDIPAGPPVKRMKANVPEHVNVQRAILQDRVAQARVYRVWVAPGRTDPVTPSLDVAAAILASGNSSRFYNDLVRDKKLATGVRGYVQAHESASFFQLEADVAPGVDPKLVDARVDELVAQFLADGPTADEVARVAMRAVSGTVKGLEEVGGFGGKAATLAEGALYAGDPAFYKTELQRYAAATPDSVAAAARRWINDGAYALTVLPYGNPQAAATGADRSKLPAVTAGKDLDFPDVERAQLSNGIPVVFARRATVPVINMSISFDAGIAADSRAKPGLANLTMALLDEGTAKRTALQIAEESERLGASIGMGSDVDSSRVAVSALKTNLAPSVELWADIVRNPTFQPAEIERLRGITLARIDNELDQPSALALRTLPPILYGPAHPYGVPLTGSGTPEGVRAVTRDDLAAYHDSWLRPDNATIFAVGDTSLAELTPLLEKAFGDWRAPAAPKGEKSFTTVAAPASSRIVLIDRPGSPQSFILGGAPLPVRGRDDPLTLFAANEVLGGSFLARINSNLRETKGWSYGAYTNVRGALEQMPFIIQAPVQTDKTADSIKEIIAELRGYRGARLTTPEELNRVIQGNVRSLPSSYETASAVLGSLERNKIYGRPDDYQEKLSDRYRAQTAAQFDAAIKQYINPDQLVWVVVGDRAKIEADLKTLGLPIEVRAAR